MSEKSILSKYKACLIGGVIGDCIGSKFENIYPLHIVEIKKHIEKVDKDKYPPHSIKYTDDTAMARKIAQSLIFNKGVNTSHLAQLFTEEYMENPRRGYGGNVINVFYELSKQENYQDPTGPAKKQFNGSGSYGNGGAMRIGPAAIFAEKMNTSDFNKVVTDVSTITHTHRDAVNGAILLAAAIKIALQLNPEEKLDHLSFIDQLHDHMTSLEQEADKAEERPTSSPESKKSRKTSPKKDKSPKREPLTTYCEKLQKIKTLLDDEKTSVKKVVDILGNDIAAFKSVPAAVFSFLRAHRFPQTMEIERSNPFERTIIYAISLGGDTDTIASMAGFIAGAYYGIDNIAESWQVPCEAVQEVTDYAEKIYEINYPDQGAVDSPIDTKS